MIECPNCGVENPATRAFCRVCAERLPRDGESPPVPSPEPHEPEPREADPAPPATSAEQPPRAAAPPSLNPNLPDWLQDSEVPEPALDDASTFEWEGDLDFTDLPEWDSPANLWQSEPAERSAGPDRWQPFGPEDPIQSTESVGTGLLAGVRGPLPVEPIVRLPHDAPRFPERRVERDNEGAALFAQIAAGTVAPPTAAPAATPTRGSRLLPLLLLLAVIVPLLLPRLALFGPPPLLPSVVAFGETLDALPPQSTVLLAFDYDGGMRDEMEVAAVAALAGLRAQAAEGGPMSLVAVSTTPQGPALAERAWKQSGGPSEGIDWQNQGYLSGGVVAVRAFLPPANAPDAPDLLIVMGDESSDVQQWVEQVGLSRPALPLLAVVPAMSEAALQPYLASGQVTGLLAGLPAAASFERFYLDRSGDATRRMDALSLGALLLLAVIVAGNLAALGGRLHRRGERGAS